MQGLSRRLFRILDVTPFWPRRRSSRRNAPSRPTSSCAGISSTSCRRVSTGCGIMAGPACRQAGAPGGEKTPDDRRDVAGGRHRRGAQGRRTGAVAPALSALRQFHTGLRRHPACAEPPACQAAGRSAGRDSPPPAGLRKMTTGRRQLPRPPRPRRTAGARRSFATVTSRRTWSGR